MDRFAPVNLSTLVAWRLGWMRLWHGTSRVRGYVVDKKEAKVIEVTEPGDWIVGADGTATKAT